MFLQTKFDIPGNMFQRNIHPFSLCRFWKSSWQVISLFFPLFQLDEETCHLSGLTDILTFAACGLSVKFCSCAHLTALRRDSIGNGSLPLTWLLLLMVFFPDSPQS